MLSRLASSLFRLGQLAERADHVARVLDVHAALALDGSEPRDRTFWAGLETLLGAPHNSEAEFRSTVDGLVIGDHARSIRASVQGARRAAQSVRPSLSSEAFECINSLHWELDESDRHHDLHEFLIRTQRGIQLLWGLVDDSMSHDQAWDFLRLGKYLERSGNVTRLVTGKLAEQAGAEPGEWAAVLRCCSAFEAYRWKFSAAVTPERVAGFLLLEPSLPRSAAHCVNEALDSVRRVDPPGAQSQPHRLLGRLASLLSYTVPEELAADPGGFSSAFTALHGALRDSLYSTYFRPSRVPSRASVPAPAWAQPQQQQ